MHFISTAFAAIAVLISGALAEDAPPAAAAPSWFTGEIAALTAGSGRWITDNSAYKNENEPYDQYGIEWKSSFDGTTMTGRLFGVKDGKEVADFWEFRQYWHPGRKEAVLEQFGWGGTVGAGRHWREGDVSKSDQTFYTVDGASSRTGHHASMPDPDTHVTESFDIVDDAWTPRRKYIWKRQPADEQG